EGRPKNRVGGRSPTNDPAGPPSPPPGAAAGRPSLDLPLRRRAAGRPLAPGRGGHRRGRRRSRGRARLLQPPAPDRLPPPDPPRRAGGPGVLPAPPRGGVALPPGARLRRRR